MIRVDQYPKQVGGITQYIVVCEYSEDAEKFMKAMRYINARVR